MRVIYSKRSSKTGRALKRALKNVPSTKVLRWGTTNTENIRQDTVEINAVDATRRAVNKVRMFEFLKDAGIAIPKFSADLNADAVNALANSDGYVYTRFKGCTQFVKAKYCIDQGHALKYVTKPVPYKRREYRVHVFQGRIFAMYEKCPHDTAKRPALFKAENCKFKRVDPTVSLCGVAGQKMAIAAVQALGLDYGAVDLIRTQNGRKYVVCEVNSSAGLNSANVARLVELIKASL